ncbi:MAG: hypothetical protein LLG02_07435 [Pelosinus sp.]|nr:hypothetical protein [Pelosinus sp.]
MKSLFSILKSIAGVLFGMSILSFSGNIAEAYPVPDDYIVWDRMPAEAPVQMQLQAQTDVSLYVRPNGNVIADQLMAGLSAERISVAVLTHPSAHPIKVLKQTQTYKSQYSQKPDGPILNQGDTVYLMMYTGEGTYLGWYEGEQVWWLPGGISDFSNRQISSPWAQYIGQATDAALGVNTWYCLRKTDGAVGWTQVQFDGRWKEPFKAQWQK